MNCENILCIYQSEGICTLDKISINLCGMCAACICPDIDENILKEAKRALLEKYEKADADMENTTK